MGSYSKDGEDHENLDGRFEIDGRGGSALAGGDGRRFIYGSSARRAYKKNLSLEQCAAMAHNDPVAEGFLYRPNVRRCYILHTLTVRDTVSTYALSYRASAPLEPEGFVLATTGGTQRGGDGRKLSTSKSRVLVKGNGLSLKECAEECLLAENCAAFSYAVQKQQCTLLKSVAYRSTTSHFVGYVRNRPEGFRLVHTGIRLDGNGKRYNLSSSRRSSDRVEIDDVEECAERCNSDEGNVNGDCIGFVTEETNTKLFCYTLNQLGGVVINNENANHYLSYRRA